MPNFASCLPHHANFFTTDAPQEDLSVLVSSEDFPATSAGELDGCHVAPRIPVKRFANLAPLRKVIEFDSGVAVWKCDEVVAGGAPTEAHVAGADHSNTLELDAVVQLVETDASVS